MQLFDNHNHSQFSFDGWRSSVEECARAALSKGLSGVAFTDHCDFFIPEAKLQKGNVVSEKFDVAQQQAEVDRVQALLDLEAGVSPEDAGAGPKDAGASHGEAGSAANAEDRLKLLKGIEIGMHENHHEDIRKVLSENSFDQVIASVHYLDGVDPYYGEYYLDKDWKKAYGLYLETIYKEMVWLRDFDIMGHYDYIVRYAPYPETCMKYRDFSDIMDEMLTYLIHEGKALEINTKSYQDHKGRIVTLDSDVLKRYRELGGEIISLGSDSHVPDQAGNNFPHFATLLKSMGFRWTAHYEKRKLVQLPL